MTDQQITETGVAVSHPSITEPAIFTLRLPIGKTIELFAEAQGVDRFECKWTWVEVTHNA